MARHGPLSAAERKRAADKRDKRQAKHERRAKRAAERAQPAEAVPSDPPAREPPE